MSALAIVIVAFGLMIILTRGPFIFAPEKTRARTLQLFETDSRMRALGLAFALIGAVFLWASWGGTGTPAVVVYLFGVFALTLAVVSIIPFPGRMRRFALRVWGGFSETALRVIGVSSVIVGLMLVYFGFTL